MEWWPGARVGGFLGLLVWAPTAPRELSPQDANPTALVVPFAATFPCQRTVTFSRFSETRLRLGVGTGDELGELTEGGFHFSTLAGATAQRGGERELAWVQILASPLLLLCPPAADTAVSAPTSSPARWGWWQHLSSVSGGLRMGLAGGRTLWGC